MIAMTTVVFIINKSKEIFYNKYFIVFPNSDETN